MTNGHGENFQVLVDPTILAGSTAPGSVPARPAYAIVHHRTTGLSTDALVLAEALGCMFPGCTVMCWSLPAHFAQDYATPVLMAEVARAAMPFDAVFLLEHAHSNPPFLDPAFARRTIYIPNIEWILPADEAVVATGKIDTVVLKNDYSSDIFCSLDVAKRVRVCSATGWTSIDIADGAVTDEQDFERFIHVRGVSKQKNTHAVLHAWSQNESFPELCILAHFEDGFDIPTPLRPLPNVTLILRKLAGSERRSLQLRFGLHVGPSGAEGFGHSLNEARAAGAVLVTTDAPPMNLFVRDGETGVLVRVKRTRRRPFNRSCFNCVDAEDIASAINRVRELSVDDRRLMGQRARAAFLEDRRAFQLRIAKVLREE